MNPRTAIALRVRPSPARWKLSANLFALGLEVHDHMGDRDREALARARDDAALEPVRAPLGMRRDDHLVGAECPERVLDRLQRVAVADLAARVDPGPSETLAAGIEPLLRLLASLILVRGPLPHRRVHRRRDNQHLRVVALAA